MPGGGLFLQLSISVVSMELHQHSAKTSLCPSLTKRKSRTSCRSKKAYLLKERCLSRLAWGM